MPLLFIYKQGRCLYKKPIHELGEDTQAVKRRQSSSDVRDKRLKGMSLRVPSIGIALTLCGLYFSFTDEGYGSPIMPYYFGTFFLGFSVISILKFKAHRKDNKILKQQNSLVGKNKKRKH